MTYTSEKPNFCMKCGKGFAGAEVTATASQDDVEANPGEGFIPQLNKLDFEIISEKPTEVTFGQIFEDAKRQETPPSSDPGYVPEEKTPEQAAEEFQREAGTLRPKQQRKDG
jgi:hypothetical protein